MQNSYHRTCLSYAQMAEYIYNTIPDPSERTRKIQFVVRSSNPDGFADPALAGFRNLLRFKEVVPHLVWLLRAGGIWTVSCDDAYAALVRCRVEQVCRRL